MPDPKKITKAEKLQAKADYKLLSKPAPSGDNEYDDFRKHRDKKREKIAGKTNMSTKSEKMSDETAAYCGKGGCSSNPGSSGDGNNVSVVSGTKKQTRGGASYRASGSGSLKSKQRKQGKADTSALALASRSNASEYDVKRGELVKSRLGLQEASRERASQTAYNKKKPSATTLSQK